MDSNCSVTSLDGFIDYKNIEKKMYYNRKFSLNLRTYACFSLSGYGGRHLVKLKTLKDASWASFRFRF